MSRDINNYAPQSGRVIGEDGEIYNIVDLFQNAGGGGGSSMRFLFGVTNPGSDDGQPGDVFLNTDSGDIFSNENGTWDLKGNLRGPQGSPGSDADPQFTQDQVDALLALIDESSGD